MSRQRRKHQSTEAAVDPGLRRPFITRRAFLGSAAGGVALVALGGLVWQRRSLGAAFDTITVYKSPTCDCCGKWITHMRGRGFDLDVREMADIVSPKRGLRIPESLYSCHTATVQGYVFEGHVPADLVAQVLRERPDLQGLAVPGMPQSAPGMDIGHQPYDVIAFTATGRTSVYATRTS